MAARGVRLNRRHQEMVREKIRASQIINRLQKHMVGKLDMTPSQMKAAEILLRKCLPDLQSVEHTGELTFRDASQLSREELLRIAAGSSEGAAEAGSGDGEPSQVH